MHIVAGTAGHIDHGKTSVIRALTGTDTDRLPEEKKRGITIDLGFAEMNLGEQRIGFVDVPGHERFVKNMLAGASGIDLVILVIAADEGVMPQTREHFDICRLLGVESGIIVLTKKDIVDDEMLDLVRLDAAELVEGSFLENAPVVAVSATTGEGIDELANALADAAGSVRATRSDQVARLAVDRSFVIKGFGTVVTGTLAGSDISEGDEMELLPGRRKVRVRGLQTHGKETPTASAGQRVAVNLAGIDHDEVSRGMTLCETAALEPVHFFDAHVEVLKNAARPLRSRQRVRVHIGTAEALARVRVLNDQGEIAPGSADFVQLRLETPAAAVMDEAFIVRSYSPQTTIAGGRVIDPVPHKHRAREISTVREFLERLHLAAGGPGEIVRTLIETAGLRGETVHGLQARTGMRRMVLEQILATDIAAGRTMVAGGRWVSANAFLELKNVIARTLAEHHAREPLSQGMPREVLGESSARRADPAVFRAALAALEAENVATMDGDLVRLSAHSQTVGPEGKAFLEKIVSVINSAGLEPPKMIDAAESARNGTKIAAAEVRKLISVAEKNGDLVRVSEDLFFSGPVIEKLTQRLREQAATLPNRLIDVPAFKGLAGVSRKFAIPLLEYYDRVGITKRAGDKRIIV
jgi:selenocysteine-specific elongation factor